MSDPRNSQLMSVLATLAAHYPDGDVAQVRDAFEHLAVQCRERGVRVDIGHELETVLVLANLRVDPPALAAALLAPLVVDGDQPAASFRERFGGEVADLLDGVARLARIQWDRIEEEAAETLRKMFLAMARDVRVVLVVLAIRVRKMRELRVDSASVVDAERVARETLEVFAPLANRLGIWQLKWELEDGALRVLEPEVFHEITRLLEESRAERQAFITAVMETLKAELDAAGVAASMKGRAKHVYSIYKKMQRKSLSFDELYDISAVRVLTDEIKDCYAALGAVHSLWVPVPGEFDDYVAKPKNNGYQSLHTAVVGPEGRPLEVQIRTHEMHQFAEFGVAAHWAYKEAKQSAADEKFMVLRRLMDWERDLSDPHQFVESLKTDVFEDQVYVFTPGGDIIDLPQGATPLDFAYRIHTEVGHRCRGAKVNDQIQPLDYNLKTGERVEILTQKQSAPSRDWMNLAFGYLQTSSARTKVRQWFRLQGRDEAIASGRELVDKELKRLELKHATVEQIAELLKYPTVEDLFAAVGYGDRSPQSVGSGALQIERDNAPPSEPQVPPSVGPERRKKAASGVSLQGVDDILGKRARCCNPVPGDKVVGFVTRGRGVVIHRRDCQHVTHSDEPERLVDIDWGPETGDRHPVDIQIRAHDRPGLLRDLSNLITNAGVNMTSARVETHKDGSAWLKLGLEFRSAEEVVKVLQRIDRYPGILEVRRIAR